MTADDAPSTAESPPGKSQIPVRPDHLKRQRRFKLLLAGVSLLVILPLFAEIGCRIHRFTRDQVGAKYLTAHPTLYEETRDVTEAYRESLWLEMYARYLPGASLTLDVGGVPYVVNINSLGYRDREFTVKKPPGVVRIACLGGSTTVQGVRNEETYPALLEQLLKARFGESVQVLNLGISGICSDFWLKHPGKLTELLQLEPDIVVQYEGFNDIYHQLFPAFEAQHPMKAWLLNSYIFELCFPIRPTEMDALFDPAIQNLSKLHEVLQANGALHVVGTFARPEYSRAAADQRAYFDFNMLYWRKNSAPRWYATYGKLLDRYNAKLAAQARAQGWILSPVRARVSGPTQFVDICHMTPPGIASLAAAFEPEVAQAVDLVRRTRARTANQ